MKNIRSTKGCFKVPDCAKEQEVKEEETSDFPMILYKRSSCSFVKGGLFGVDVELGVYCF